MSAKYQSERSAADPVVCAENPFADLTGANPTSIIVRYLLGAFLGVAALKLLKTMWRKANAS